MSEDGNGAATETKGLFTETGINIEAVKAHLGDDFFNDPDKKSEPTKMFDNLKSEKDLLKMAATAQRKATQNEKTYGDKYAKEYAEKTKGMVKLPAPDAKPDSPEVIAYRKAVGVPDAVEGYQMPIPENAIEEDKPLYNEIAKITAAEAHKLGIPKGMAEALFKNAINTVNTHFAAMTNNGLSAIQADEAKLKEQYKEKYDEFVKTTDAVLAKTKTGKEFELLVKANPLVRNLIAEFAPLVLEGKTFGGDTGKTAGDAEGSTDKPKTGGMTYCYHDNGVPMTKEEAIAAGKIDKDGNVL